MLFHILYFLFFPKLIIIRHCPIVNMDRTNNKVKLVFRICAVLFITLEQLLNLVNNATVHLAGRIVISGTAFNIDYGQTILCFLRANDIVGKCFQCIS